MEHGGNVGRSEVWRMESLIACQFISIRDYYDLLLNDETGRYIYRVAALKLIMSDPGAYGYRFEKEDLYPPIPTYDVTVEGPVEDFAEFAARYSINYKILKIFNPWLRDNKLTNSRGKTYYISIPQKGYREFSYLDELSDESEDL